MVRRGFCAEKGGPALWLGGRSVDVREGPGRKALSDPSNL